MDWKVNIADALPLEKFIEMDRLAIERFELPIELMMENAGLQLARLVSQKASRSQKILVGVGNGNNGGGGLVAARRLAAWGFSVYLDLPVQLNRELPSRQLERALAFGASQNTASAPDIWIDAYLGFSQRRPLTKQLQESINAANMSSAVRISLDLPTAFADPTSAFKADVIMTLAAPKELLSHLASVSELYLADISIPEIIYREFGISYPPFHKEQLLRFEFSEN